MWVDGFDGRERRKDRGAGDVLPSCDNGSGSMTNPAAGERTAGYGGGEGQAPVPALKTVRNAVE
ncbi:hypothetical protein GCM10022206_83740 [Streptomyces chiangmaiensis]